MEKIFTGNGIEIVKHDNSYYLIYDAGEICDRMEKIQITEEEIFINPIPSEKPLRYNEASDKSGFHMIFA